jgi:exodeoxyribonuclease VII small subunit
MTKNIKSESKNLSFEEAMEKLETIAHELEAGDLSLDRSISSFEEGMKLAKLCEDNLTEISGRVEKVMKDFSGKKKITPLTESDTDDI